MKTIQPKLWILTTLLLASNFNAACQWISGYSYRSQISINSDYITDDLTDFPFHFRLDDSDFAFLENCGKVKNEGGYDIAFTDHSGTLLEHDISEYDSETGTFRVWVNVPAVSSSVDTDIFMFYGRRGLSVDPSTSSTYSSENLCVYHFDEIGQLDATANSKSIDLSLFSDTDLIPGNISQALQFDGSTQYASRVYDSDFDFGSNSFSLSGWIKTKTKSGSDPVETQTIVHDVSSHVEQGLNTDDNIDGGSSDLELGRNISDFGDFSRVALQFDNLGIPQGAQVIDAYLLFEVDELTSGSAKFFIDVEDSASPNSLGTSNPNRPNDRTYAGISISWSPTPWDEVALQHRTTDISELVQHVVNKGDWSSGNSIIFSITGVGERTAESDPVKLVVKFESVQTTDFSVRVNESIDDSEEREDGSYTSVADLNFNPDDSKYVGVRFTDLQIPNGAILKEAKIRFEAAESNSDASQINIYAENTLNSDPFSGGDDFFTNKDKTTSLSWVPSEWTQNNVYETPDIKSIISEFFQDEDWQSGNALTFILEPTQGDRVSKARGEGSSVAPELVLKYTLAANFDQTVVSRADASGGFKVWSDLAGRLVFGVDQDSDWDDESSVSSLYSVTDQSWHHFAAVKHADDSLSLYLDGAYQDSYILNAETALAIISDDGDDIAEELTDNSIDDFDYPYLGQDGAGDAQLVGLRFQGISIPRNAIIVSARLQVIASASASGSCSLTISGDTQPSSSYTGASSGEVSTRAANSGTTASSNWAVPSFSSDESYNSPDISGVIQEIVNSGSWPVSGGADLGLFIEGAGNRRIHSYNREPGLAPSLFIQYKLSSYGSVSGASPTLIIGDDGSGEENYLGQIDELRIIDDQLSSAEILAQYSNIAESDFFGITASDQATWTGSAADNDWSNPSNWNTGLAPWSYIDFVLGSNITLDQNCTVGGMSATVGSSIDLATSFQMQMDCDCEIEEIQNGIAIVNENMTISLPTGSSASEIRIDELQIADEKNMYLGSDLRLDDELAFVGQGHIVSNGNTITMTKNLFPTSYDQNIDFNRTIVLNNGGKLAVEDVAQGESAVLNISLDLSPTTFSRVELTNNSLTARNFDVSICDDVYTDGTCDGGGGGSQLTSDALDFTWDVNSSTNESTNVVFYWNEAMEMSGFNRSTALISYHDGSRWQSVEKVTSVGNYTNNIHSVDGVLSSFSPKGVGHEGVPLPVELVDYQALADGNNILVKWSTSSELNNDYFLLEKSLDGIQFSSLATIQGAGTSNTTQYYEFRDIDPTLGYQYYRLKQVDFDGTEKTLGIEIVDYNGGIVFNIQLYPNPTKTQLIIDNLPRGHSTIEVIDAWGHKMHSEQIFIESIGQSHKVDVSQFPDGIYFLHVINDKIDYSKKFVIQG